MTSECPTCTGTRRAGGWIRPHRRVEYKHVWAVWHDGLLFASGWHATADEYTQFVVDEAIARYHADGLDATLEHYNNPESVDAQWYVFVAAPDGELLGHYNSGELGPHLEEMLSDGTFRAAEEGIWVTHEDMNPVTGEIEDKHFQRGQTPTLDPGTAVLAGQTRRRRFIEARVQTQTGYEGNRLRQRLAEVQQVQDGVAPVPHQHQGTAGQPAPELQNHLTGPAGELLGSASSLPEILFRGSQHGQKRQGPTASGPRNMAQRRPLTLTR